MMKDFKIEYCHIEWICEAWTNLYRDISKALDTFYFFSFTSK